MLKVQKLKFAQSLKKKTSPLRFGWQQSKNSF